jgi:hypothetical protein
VASVVLAAGNVYYASEDGQLLGRVAKQGPACVGSACLTADVSFKPSLLATDGVSIFAASSEANGVLAQFDTGLSKSITLSTVSKVTHLVAGGGRVFWASDEGKTLVRSIPVNGGAVAEVVTLPPSDDARVTALATDGNQLVWAVEKQTSPPSYGIYRVGVSKSCSFATCVPLVTTSDRVTSLALDSEFVYFASKDGAVRKVLKAGGCGGISPCPIVLAERQPDPSTVLVDDDSLYWAAGDGTVRVSSVYRLCRGSRCQAIAGRLGAILGLARDERGIFMAVQDSLVMAGGAVYFIANRK